MCFISLAIYLIMALPKTPIMGFLVIGHRGASRYELENSISSLQHALDLGVNAIEADIRATRDGKPIILHDVRLRRVSRTFAKITGLRARDVSKIRLRNGEPVPFLTDIISKIKGRGQLILDIKVSGIEMEIVRVIKRNSMVSDTIISSFMPEVLRKIKVQCPKIRVALLCYRFNETLIESAKQMDCFSIHPRSKAVTPSLIAYAHNLGMRIFPWTEDRISRVTELMEYGIDGIITNYPDIIDLAVKHMKNKDFPLQFDSLF